MTNIGRDVSKMVRQLEQLQEYREHLKEREDDLEIYMRGSNDLYILGRQEELADVIEMLDGIFGEL